jgi:hypothetical protein
MFHCRISTGSPRASLKLYTAELGMCAALQDSIHDESASFLHAAFCQLHVQARNVTVQSDSEQCS